MMMPNCSHNCESTNGTPSNVDKQTIEVNIPNYLTIPPSCPRLFSVCPQVPSPEAFVPDMFHCELAVMFLP